ncbi:M48 family metalloprotease [Pseudomonas sp. D(2018)]|uniref:M48 family metalloprotease n=1 Tax=Pseudomonas sp. D(2018) TaxID=2502238 RepID=UPI0010F8F8CC|nr:M48 family metalloprotease [Pseudomonas sp. D(2018)]
MKAYIPATCCTFAAAALLMACNGASITNPFDATGDPAQVKTFTKLTPRAAVVVDRNCPQLVQPYRLSDNAASLIQFNVTEVLKGLPGQLSSILSSSPTPDTGSQLSDSTKLAAKQLNWLPMSAEVHYAKRQHDTRKDLLPRDNKLGRKHYPVADKMLSDILASVGEPHDYDFKLFIVKTSNRNALALPGGYLYLDQGLLNDPKQHPKAYFALAHEVAHVLQRHETKEMQSLVVDSFSVKADLVDTIKDANSSPEKVVDRIKLEKGQFTRHHIDQELQADSCAVKMLSEVYPDSQGLSSSINAFVKDLPPMEPTASRAAPKNQAEAVADNVYDIVNSPLMRHPNTRERTENLQAIYREVTSSSASAAAN